MDLERAAGFLLKQQAKHDAWIEEHRAIMREHDERLREHDERLRQHEQWMSQYDERMLRAEERTTRLEHIAASQQQDVAGLMAVAKTQQEQTGQLVGITAAIATRFDHLAAHVDERFDRLTKAIESLVRGKAAAVTLRNRECE